jgi:hypothetical protein
MSTRAAEYRLLIDDILAEDAALRAQGLPGLDLFEIMELRDMVARANRRALSAAPGDVAPAKREAAK